MPAWRDPTTLVVVSVLNYPHSTGLELGRCTCRLMFTRDVPPPWPDVGEGTTLREIVVRRPNLGREY